MEFKTLDSTISTHDKASNTWTSNNYRCVDIDRLVPQYMGVSKVGGWVGGCAWWG